VNLEKLLAFKRSFIGYSTISVLEKMQSTQENYQNELTGLKDRIGIEKEMIKKLKLEFELNYSLPQTNSTGKNMNSVVNDMIEQLVMNTKSIEELQKELEEQESTFSQELELKKQQKYLAKKRIQEALQYLKTLSETENEFKKKQRV